MSALPRRHPSPPKHLAHDTQAPRTSPLSLRERGRGEGAPKALRYLCSLLHPSLRTSPLSLWERGRGEGRPDSSGRITSAAAGGSFIAYLILLAACTLAGCAAPCPSATPDASVPAIAQPASHSPAPPLMTVTLWSGDELTGPVAWLPDGSVSIGERSVKSDDIRLMQAAHAAAETGALELSALPEGFRPLDDASLAAYRKRAVEASEKYKGSDSVLCLDYGMDMLTKDWRQVYRYHALYLILKEPGRGVANVSVHYSEGRSRARVFFARSISPDGRSTWAEADAFEETVPPEDAQFVNTRSRVLSGQTPGAAVDMLIEYAYEFELYNPEIKEYFFPGYVFQGDKPVLDSIIDIVVPAGMPLNYLAHNMPEAASKPVITKAAETDTWRWTLCDATVITPEPDMPAMEDVVARMEVSPFFDWEAIMGPTAKFQAERIIAAPTVQELAAKITAGTSTDDEKLAKIYHWVQRNITYLSVKASLASGWAGHPAAEVCLAGYGDCTDVTNLTVSLARAVGIDAYPLIIKTNGAGEMTTDIPLPDANHAIVLAYPNGRQHFLDPTAENFRYPYFRADDHGIKAVVHMKREIIFIPVPPPEDNARVSRQEIALDAEGGAKIIERNAYTGSYEAGIRGYWRSVPPEMRPMIMQQSLQTRSPGARIANLEIHDLDDLDKQLTMTLDYEIPALATMMEDLYIFSLPNFKQQFPETALDRRTYDIETMTTEMYDTEVSIAVPERMRPTGLPQPLKVDSPYLYFEGSVTPSNDGRTIIARQITKHLTRVIPVADYQSYRRDAAAVAAWTDMKILLRRESAPVPAADVTLEVTQ